MMMTSEMDITKHSIVRAKERAGLNEKRARRMICKALERGISSKECKWSSDRKFLELRSGNGKEAIAYNGYCFIICRETNSCLTVFELPKDFGKKKTYYQKEDSWKRELQLVW